MSALDAPARERDARLRGGRAEARRRRGELERREGHLRVRYERVAARLVLGEVGEEDLAEAEADLDLVSRDLRRVRAAVSYLVV